MNFKEGIKSLFMRYFINSSAYLLFIRKLDIVLNKTKGVSMKSIFSAVLIVSLGFMGLFADDDVNKNKEYKNSEKSFEKASEKAKFKRTDEEKKYKKKKDDDEDEDKKEKKEKKVKKEKKEKKVKKEKKNKKEKKDKKFKKGKK